jgi:hypothetical protein
MDTWGGIAVDFSHPIGVDFVVFPMNHRNHSMSLMSREDLGLRR